ncbi:MAG: DinB family protein [Bacteroidota bacterium]
MKEYLLDTFIYNDWANRQLLETIFTLPEKEESIIVFSHLIVAQDKWFNRIGKEKDDHTLSWSGSVFQEEELADQWHQSVSQWIRFLESHPDSELNKDVTFIRQSDGKNMSVTIKDVMLQLNYHAIHHRAQINRMISKQGIKPPATDYIYTVLKETS